MEGRVQRRNVLEGTPGPADYTPNIPKGTKLKLLGPKAERFTTGKYDVIPGPAEYSIKRDFDIAEPPQIFSNAKIATPAFFGIKAERFKPRHEEGPSPASYDPSSRLRQSNRCIKTPFGSTSKRFKEIPNNGVTNFELISGERTRKDSSDKYITMELPTWGFRSKTIRWKPLLKKFHEPSPADLAQAKIEIRRSHQLQYNCPFFSSDGRFQPWFNWIPVHGKNKTPGPAYYCLDKPKCLPAVNCGPMYRTTRFADRALQTPAPNAYRVDGGIENILATHNDKLKNNLANKHEYHWSPPLEYKKLSVDTQEAILLKKSIALLEVPDNFEYKESSITKSVAPTITSHETKLLRCFLKSQQIARY
ncbi:jg16203 [Pararge aegeria aegeria]|uniref:Jg16203 protein n=1 Tax=Pararge aegeria aegeria TaxID=348720 RepID=A0A8S4QNG8_9NEOP|nr:jg16203 [Pararge aegeria aegeria]